MDFNQLFYNLNEEISSLEEKLKNLKGSYKEAESFTKEFLSLCKKRGLKIAGISKVPEEMEFPFGGYGSVFGIGKDFNGWPAIWKVVEELKIGAGAGNNDQHQAETNNLIDGVYELKNGNWFKRE